MPRDLTLEDQLCLLLARGQLPPDLRARARDLLAASLRWPLVLKRAEEHQVLPLLYRSLRTLEFQSVPGEVQAKLKAEFRLNAVRNMLFVSELTRVLGLLREAGIRVLPLKGVALAELLYGDPAFRYCSDIDILVPPRDALAARRLLLAQGYTSPFSENFFLHHQFHHSADSPLEMQKGGLAYFLELHWTLLDHLHKDREAVADLWAQSQARELFGTPTSQLSPEWEFLYLAGHAGTHRWQMLKWIADIHDFCAATSIDWRKMQDMAVRFDLELIVAATLAVCAELYGMPAPPNFPSAQLPAGVELFPHSLEPTQAWNAPLFYPKLLKRPSEKLRWYLERCFVARQADHRFFHLPAALSFLYFVLRPLRLLGKWSGRFLRVGAGRLGRWLRGTRE